MQHSTMFMTLLPTELLEKFVKQVLPDDILNFSGTCRRFYQVSSQARAQHREWSQDPTVFEIGDRTDDVGGDCNYDDGDTVAALAEELLECVHDDNRALYKTTLYLYEFWPGNLSRRTERALQELVKHSRFCEDGDIDRQILRKASEGSIKDLLVDPFSRNFTSDILLTLALRFLPRLQSLYVSNERFPFTKKKITDIIQDD